MQRAFGNVALFLQRPRNLFVCAGALSGGVVCIKSAPHIFPGYFFTPLYQSHNKKGEPNQLVPSQKKEFLDVTKDLGIKPKHYDVFVNSHFDIMWRGLPWFPSGVKFGIPEILQDKPDVSTRRFPEPIKSKLNTEEGQKLKETLTLSEKGRKFALAKEITLIDKNFPVYPMVVAPCMITANFGSIALIQITRAIPLPNYALVALLSIPFYCLYQLAMSVIVERTDLRVDEKLIKVGPVYQEGGVEYYGKRLEKNIALRKLLGKKGEKLFTYYGNERPGGIFGLRSFGAPITLKLTRMQKSLQDS